MSRGLPPPHAVRALTPAGAFTVTGAVVACSLSLVATSLFWEGAGVGHAVIAAVVTILAAVVTRSALRTPTRIGRRCVAAAVSAGGVTGSLALVGFASTCGLRVGGPSDALGIAAIVGGVFAWGALWVVVGAVLGLAGAALVRVEADRAEDVADELLQRGGAWLVGAGALVAWLGARGPGRLSAGLAILGAGALASLVACARDRRRARWLGRVAAGREPRWVVVEARSVADGGELPRYVGLDPAVCDGALARRPEGEAAPFRASSRVVAVARLDVGAGRAMALVRRRAGLAAVAVALATLAAGAAVVKARRTPALPERVVEVAPGPW